MRRTSDIRVRQTGSDIGKFPHAWVRAAWGCEQGQVGLSRVGSGSAVGTQTWDRACLLDRFVRKRAPGCVLPKSVTSLCILVGVSL